MTFNDPYNLNRFLIAQEEDYQIALSELTRGQKHSHWIWYIFPQVAGLGYSSMAVEYAIRSKQEALAYLDHEVLGSRLNECARVLLNHQGRRIEDIMGYPDDLKLQSSMTLFASLCDHDNVFLDVINLFYCGNMDSKTLTFLS